MSLLHWQNLQEITSVVNSNRIKRSEDQGSPQKRWGHTSVEAMNRMFIIGGYHGQYLGDIWMFDFRKLEYLEVPIDAHFTSSEISGLSPDQISSKSETLKQQLQRSNHTSVFYKQHNSIYVFGGGHAQKKRFNDTLRIQLPQISDSNFMDGSELAKMSLKMINPLMEKSVKEQETWKVTLSSVKVSSAPDPRTYHASTLMDRYMIIVGGESISSGDLNDFWALDLDSMSWIKPDITGLEHFCHKRFHTANSIGTKVVTFGGCHSEYVHLNDLNIFEMESWLQDKTQPIVCTKIAASQLTPSTRWGHGAAVNGNQLIILGGRNESDINDVHTFDTDKLEWTLIEVGHPQPKPRRRHSTIFVSNCLVMFGGFDGEFFNDLNVMDMSKASTPQDTEIEFSSLVDSQANHDLIFRLHGESPESNQIFQDVFAIKSLVLFRSIHKEVPIIQSSQSSQISQCVQSKSCPEFLRSVYNQELVEVNLMPEWNQQDTKVTFRQKVHAFKHLICYLQSEKFSRQMTLSECEVILVLCQHLGLKNTAEEIALRSQQLHSKLASRVQRDLQIKQFQSMGGDTSNQEHKETMNGHLKIELDRELSKLRCSLLFDFSSKSEEESPEQEQNHNLALQKMKICMSLDEFFDTVFNLDGNSYIKGNSFVLMDRSEYFRAMLSQSNGFKEVSEKYFQSGSNTFRLVKIKGVPKSIFNCIIQYLYSGHFYIGQQSIEFFLQVMIYADYFMVPKLTQICCKYINQFITHRNVLAVLLLSHAHNCPELENFCLEFICLNEAFILSSKVWKQFKQMITPQLNKYFMNQILNYKSENFVQHSIELFVRENSRIAKKLIFPQIEQLTLEPWRRKADSCSSSSEDKIPTPEDSSSDGEEEASEMMSLQKLGAHVFIEEHHSISYYQLSKFNFKFDNKENFMFQTSKTEQRVEDSQLLKRAPLKELSEEQ